MAGAPSGFRCLVTCLPPGSATVTLAIHQCSLLRGSPQGSLRLYLALNYMSFPLNAPLGCAVLGKHSIEDFCLFRREDGDRPMNCVLAPGSSVLALMERIGRPSDCLSLCSGTGSPARVPPVVSPGQMFRTPSQLTGSWCTWGSSPG